MKFHIFNPGHDEALAAGTPYYTHTRAARALATAQWHLPKLWAAEDDEVLSLDALNEFKEWEKVERIEPWGWDAALVHQLRKAGAPDRLLPDDKALAAIRTLSSRETAVRLLAEIDKPDGVTSAFLHDLQSVCAFAEKHGGAMAKAPWSCSGRGLIRLSPCPTLTQCNRVENILKRQGAIAVEPYFDRTADFAMEFLAETNTTVRFLGLSFFETDSTGHYLGNIVAMDETILQRLAPFPFEEIKKQVGRALEDVLGGKYVGPLGVDMLQFRTPAGIATHPCIEINLRRTMGYAALALRKRLATPTDSFILSLDLSNSSQIHDTQ